MKYRWDFYDIRNNYQELLKNGDGSPYSVESIERYRKLLYVNRPDLYIDKVSELSDDINISYGDYIEKIISFYVLNNPIYIDYLTGCYSVVKNSVNKLSGNYYIALSNEELIDITLDFYQKMLPNLYNPVKDLFSNNKNFLNIRYTKYSNYHDNVTLFESENKNKRILITRHNDMLDFIGLPHELMHYLLNDCDMHKYLDSDCKFLVEIEGWLSNLLFSEYYSKYASNLFTDSYDSNGNNYNDKNFYKEHFLKDLEHYIEHFIVKNELLLSINKNGKFDVKKFVKKVNKYGFLNPETEYFDTLLYLGSDEETHLKYGLDLLIGMDLYEQALNDPEYAINNILNIKRIKESSNIIPILKDNNITFMTDNYKSLKKYIKNMTN